MGTFLSVSFCERILSRISYRVPFSGEGFRPGPEEKKGEAGIHKQVNDFVGMQEDLVTL